MRILILLLSSTILFCAPMPNPDTHRNCCADYERLLRISIDMRAKHERLDEMILKCEKLVEENLILKAKYEGR